MQARTKEYKSIRPFHGDKDSKKRAEDVGSIKREERTMEEAGI